MFSYTDEQWKELNGYNTAKEINQQPRLWKETLNIIENNKKRIEEFLKENMTEDTDVIFTGAGTSAYVGEIVAPYLQKTQKGNFKAVATTDIVPDPRAHFSEEIPTILVSFARSGNSPESVATFNLANKIIKNIKHIFITCNPEGELAKISKDRDDILSLIMPEQSNDKGFAMTSSFSCMTLTAQTIFNMDDFKESKKEILELVSQGEKILARSQNDLEDILGENFNRVVYLGTSSLYGLAKESALKLLELTTGQVVGYSESVLGFRHGPKSILDDNTLVFVYFSEDQYTRKYDMDILKEMYHNPGFHKVIGISKLRDKEIEENSDYHLNILNDSKSINNDVYISLLFALYAQVFSLLSSLKAKVEPDNPNPSGIVNRVVQGVVIYEY